MVMLSDGVVRVLRRSSGPPVSTALSELVGPVDRLRAADGQHEGRTESGHLVCVIAASHVSRMTQPHKRFRCRPIRG